MYEYKIRIIHICVEVIVSNYFASIAEKSFVSK